MGIGVEAFFTNESPLTLGGSSVPEGNMEPLPGVGFLSFQAN